MKYVFVLSTGRTGTKFLSNFFSDLSPKIKSLHEPFYSRHFRIFSNLYFHKKIKKKMLREIFKISRYNIFNLKNYDFYIESNNFLSGFGEALIELIPDVYIIHIVRDPRNYIQSHINHGIFKGEKRIYLKYIPYTLYKKKKRAWNNNKIEILAERWVFINNKLFELSNICKNYKMIYFEDMFNNLEMKELNNFIGIEYKDDFFFRKIQKKENFSTMQIMDSWQKWSKKTAITVNNICKELMQKLNYGNEDNWKSLIS